MKKVCKVLMLPANEKTNISLGNSDKGMIYHTHTKPEYTERKYQHLYILSDDEIKEGDWYIHMQVNKIYQSNKDNCYLVKGRDYLKKIIATTDEWLGTNDGMQGANSMFNKFPQPSQSFIEKYVEEYNKGNIITEVMVEYKGACYNCGEYHENSVLCMDMYSGEYDPEQEPFIPKINEGNTITISNVKDTYTREEVEKFTFHFNKWRKESGDLGMDEPAIILKWIEENL